MYYKNRYFCTHLNNLINYLVYAFYKDYYLYSLIGKIDNIIEYCEYVLLYIDNVLIVSQYPNNTLQRIGKYFTLKYGSVDPLKIYIRAKLLKIQLSNGVNS